LNLACATTRRITRRKHRYGVDKRGVIWTCGGVDDALWWRCISSRNRYHWIGVSAVCRGERPSETSAFAKVLFGDITAAGELLRVALIIGLAKAWRIHSA